MCFMWLYTYECVLALMKLGNAPLNLVNLFEKSSTTQPYNTRSFTSENFHVKRSRLKIQKYSVPPFGVTLWNEISHCVPYVNRQYLVLPRLALAKFYNFYSRKSWRSWKLLAFNIALLFAVKLFQWVSDIKKVICMKIIIFLKILSCLEDIKSRWSRLHL